MPYIQIEDFRNGLDTRRGDVETPPGALLYLNNAHITRGGEIEKRYAFSAFGDAMPTGDTLGLAVKDGVPYVFGADSEATVRAAGLDNDIGYQQLAPPGGRTLNDILDWDLYAGKFYVVAEMDNFSVQHYYDGTIIPDADYFSAAGLSRGLTATTYREKLYTVRDEYLMFSKLLVPNKFGTNQTDYQGSGYINAAAQAPTTFDLTTSAAYLNRLAVFARNTTLIYTVDPDPARNVLEQVLTSIGCLAPRSAIGYGEQDVFFLSESGVRSLRARQDTTIASVNDIGTPIDGLVVAYLDTIGLDQAYYAQACIEPRTGSYWLALGSTIYVLSLYPQSKIAAWSTYTPGFTVDDMVSDFRGVYLRADDQLYRYGGTDGVTYDSSTVTVTMPYLAANMPSTNKQWTAFDASVSGSWTVALGTDPNNTAFYETIGTISNITYPLPHLKSAAWSTHASLKFTNAAAGAAKLRSANLHYLTGKAQ